MSNTTFNLPHHELSRHYLENFLEQLTIDYQNTRSERIELAATNTVSPSEFTPLEEIELITVQLRGYASQIQFRGEIKEPSNALAQLQSLQIFALPTLAPLYWDTPGQYPQLKSYLRHLDYLRLLILDYLSFVEPSADS